MTKLKCKVIELNTPSNNALQDFNNLISETCRKPMYGDVSYNPVTNRISTKQIKIPSSLINPKR